MFKYAWTLVSMQTIAMLMLSVLEVILLKVTHVGIAQVLAQSDELVGSSGLPDEKADGKSNEHDHHVSVEVHLRSDVGSVTHTLLLSKYIVVVEAREQEGLLGGKAEHVEIILMVNQLDRSLSVGILGCGGKLFSGDTVLFEGCGHGQLILRLGGV